MAMLAQHSLIHVVKIGEASQMKGCSKRQTQKHTYTHTHRIIIIIGKLWGKNQTDCEEKVRSS